MSYGSHRSFKLVIYESEYQQIQAWTNKYEHLETGGDLFGLWQDERTAVVQLVVGPGKQCRRTSTSFYQDVDYLERIGDALTSEEGLCHIGEWHSHHTLSLSRPSEGDESTIWSNMDRYGLSRFVLFIANICTTWSWSHLSSLPDETTVNGFLFEVDPRKRRFLVLQAEFIFLQEESPFRSRHSNAIRKEAESLNTAQEELRVVLKKCQKMKSGWKKALEENNKLEKSLATERSTRRETDKRLRSSEQQVTSLQKSLIAERQAKEEIERRLYSREQRSRELATHLAAERQAREESQRRLHSSEQRSRELERHLAAERQAREEAERRLHSSEQRSRELETSLVAKQKAHEETRRNLTRSNKV